MRIYFTLNGDLVEWDANPSDTLLSVLRREGLFGVKSGGCSKGECGACAVLIDGKPVNSCTLLAAQASGHRIETIEAMGQHPEQGWKKTSGLHTIQQALVESGAIQCGYFTPVQAILRAAAVMRGEAVPPIEGTPEVENVGVPVDFTPQPGQPAGYPEGGSIASQTRVMPKIWTMAEGI